MTGEQLTLPGFEETPWDLLDRVPPPQLVDHLDRHRHDGAVRHRHDRRGPSRLLRELVRRGLAEDALLSAAALVRALDEGQGR
jgi:hypothetical protein